MRIPAGYEYLGQLGVLPKTIQEGLRLYGTVEVPGRGSNPTIIGWAKTLGLNSVYSDDSIPWCGLFAAIVARNAGKTVVKDPLWARNWAKFGTEVATRVSGKLVAKDGRKPSLGDVLVFERGTGGHVGFYAGETATHFIVLGGNQSDKVCMAALDKKRCISVRRPTYINPPASVKPIIRGATSAKAGGSEA